MRRILPFFAALCLLILPACAPALSAAPTLSPVPVLPTAPPTPTVVPPTSTPTATLQPTPTELPPTLTPSPAPPALTHYQLTVDLSFDQKTAAVQMQVAYTNPSPEALTHLRLVIPPLAYPGAFTLQSIQWAGGEAVKEAVWRENGLEIPLPTPLPPGGALALEMAYNLAFPSAAAVNSVRPVPFAYTARQVNLVDWYPFIPPYRAGQGWLAHPNSYYGESLVADLAGFDVTLRLTDARADLIAAASAPAEVNGAERRYHAPALRSFALSISPDYQIAKTTVEGIEISSYYFPAHALAGEAAPRIMAEAVALFQDLFGPYPHPTLALVEAEFLDGMEYDGLVFVSRGMYNLYGGTPAEYFHALTIHETAHQWWFALIGSDQAIEPWLDEGFSTYCEFLYYERYHPEAAQWWWDVRINYYKPSGWVNSTVYDHLGQPGNYDLYRNAVYFNGAVFLHELRQAVGDEAFFAALQDYAQQYAGQIATSQDFFAILASHTTVDIEPLMKRFFKN